MKKAGEGNTMAYIDGKAQLLNAVLYQHLKIISQGVTVINVGTRGFNSSRVAGRSTRL